MRAVELGKRTDADPITQQVVANALASIADEMATTIYRTAHSTVVRDAMDFSASLCNASGEQIAQAVTIPFHLGSVPAAMRTLLAQYQGRFLPGDVFIMNDPFDGGMHIPDVFIIKPVHWEGELVGFAATTAHHADLGGRVPGSAACDSTEIFQEGLRLPWLRLYAEGEPVEDVFKIIRANVRVPRMTVGDISAQVAACSVAERGLQDLAARYTPARLAGLVDALIEHTERLVRQEIADWPDGTAYFVDHLDSDGIDVREVPVSVRITIEGDEVTADFSDAQSMVRGALNCTRSVVEAAVYQCVRSALSVEVPNTAGVFRPINVVTRPGTLMDVEMPGASSMRGRHRLPSRRRDQRGVGGALAAPHPRRRGGRQYAGGLRWRHGGERAVRVLRARLWDLGRQPDRGWERRPLEPGVVRGEHPRRGRGGGVSDRRGQVRIRLRFRWSRRPTAAGSPSSGRGGVALRLRRWSSDRIARSIRRTDSGVASPAAPRATSSSATARRNSDCRR